MSNSSVFLPLFVVFPFVQKKFFFFESSRFGNFLMLMKKDRRLRSFIRVLFQEITFLYVQFERINSIGTMQNFVDCVFVVILMECLRAVAGFVLRMLFSSGHSPISLWNSCWIFPVQCILSRDFLLSRKFCLNM